MLVTLNFSNLSSRYKLDSPSDHNIGASEIRLFQCLEGFKFQLSDYAHAHRCSPVQLTDSFNECT